MELKGVLSGGTGVKLKGVLSGGTGVEQRWAVVELGWNSRECSEGNWDGTAVGCGGAAVGCTERNCTNTCTHLQVEHRNKLYKYKQN